MYYRGCWHIVSRGLFIRYRQFCFSTDRSSLIKEFYIPKYVFIHAALLGQSFLHCRKFPTAASRRSLGRVSVPMWPFNLSVRLRIIVLVSYYLTNKLMRRRPILKYTSGPLISKSYLNDTYPVLAIVSNGYPRLKGRLPTCYSPVRH